MNRNYIVLIFLFFIFPIHIFSQDKKDKPREGEGLNAFLKRNNCADSDCFDRFLELNKDKFAKNNTLKKGIEYTLPTSTPKESNNQTAETSSTTKKKNKLFGSKYEEYTVKSDKLKGACFFLSSGHGGPDPGAIGKVDNKQLHEDEYAYDITLRLARNLEEEGATVHMIIQDANDGIRDEAYLATGNKETCMGKKIPLNQLSRLKQRSDKINKLSKKSKDKYKRAVFIHLDSRSLKQQLDVFFYYAPKSAGGKKMATTMRETFSSHYDKHQPTRGFTGTISERSLYVLNQTAPIGIFAELGNIRNSFDQRRFIIYDNRQALANWMCRGFIKDYEDWKAQK